MLRPEAERLGCVPSDALSSRVGTTVSLAVLVAAVRNVRGRRGYLRFLTLEDEAGFVEAVWRASTLEALRAISGPGPWLVRGAVTGSPLPLEIESAIPFHRRPRPARVGS